MSARQWLRSLSGAALLIAFPAMLVVALGVLVGAEVLLLSKSVGRALLWGLIIVPASIVVVRGLRVLMTEVDGSAQGIPLREEEHPELWALVRRLASACGTRAPEEIHLNGEVTASVVEKTRLLGLVSAHRRMVIGAPLVAALRGDQFAAVLAHELAHYGNVDTRLSALAFRGRRALAATAAALDRTELLQRFLAVLLSGWTRLYLRLSSGLSRRQEYEADWAAAHAVGALAMASALREIAATTEVWQLFATRHLVMGWAAGYVPADVFGGYAELRGAMAERLETIRQNPPDEERRHATHPSVPSRVAILEAMETVPQVLCGLTPAADLLHDSATVLNAAVVAGLGPEGASKRRADWVTLAEMHGTPPARAAAARLTAAAARLTGGPPTIRTVLDALDAGRLADLAELPRKRGVGLRGRREQARPNVRDGLTAAVGLSLFEVGAAVWEPACSRLVVDPPYRAALPRLVDAAVADRPETTGLRSFLDATNVDLDATGVARREGERR
jgi:Zn-dependent protease with chaperone function